MKTKLLIIVSTFVGTTLFWGLAVAVVFAFFGEKRDVSFAPGPGQWGYSAIVTARNGESHPVTFTAVEILTNTISADTPEVVLLERQLPPGGELWLAVKKKTSGLK